MRTFFYRLWQWTWGLPQTLAGGVLFLIYRRSPHLRCRGAVVTCWDRPSGLSLGMFLFVPVDHSRSFLSHEYGHTIQSLILGPLYLPLVGLPSVLWGFHPYFIRKRREKHIPYYSVYPEKWATRLGTRFTGDPPIG